MTLPQISKVGLSLFFAVVCFIVFWIPYAGYVGLGPPSLMGVLLARAALRSGERQPLVYVALGLNLLWLLLAIVLAWGILATIMDWPGSF